MSRPENKENLMSLADQIVWAAETYGLGGMFEYQEPATLNQVAPVQNTWYDILPVTANVRVYGLTVNVEDNDETLECQAIIDGETIAAVALAATHSTNYFAFIFGDAINRIDVLSIQAGSQPVLNRAFLMEGHSVQIRIRKTTVAGVGNLTGIAIYGVLTIVS